MKVDWLSLRTTQHHAAYRKSPIYTCVCVWGGGGLQSCKYHFCVIGPIYGNCKLYYYFLILYYYI